MTAAQHDDSTFMSAIVDQLSQSAQKLYINTPDSAAEIINYRELIQRLCSQINLGESSSLLDVFLLYVEGLDQLARENRSLSFSELSILTKIPGIIRESLTSSDCQRPIRNLLDLLKNTQWIRPISHDEEKQILQAVDSESNGVDSEEGVELDDILHLSSIPDGSPSISPVPEAVKPDPQGADDPAGHTEQSELHSSINNEQQELVDLIKAELSEITNTQEEMTLALACHDRDRYRHLLENMSVQAENVSNAVGLIGLDGLNQYASFISRNLQIHLCSEDIFNNEFARILPLWPDKILAYLKNVNEPESIEELLVLLSDASWPAPLSSNDYEIVKNLLENPVFIIEEQEQRQNKATEEDVTLTLPDDVNQELLDGLLMDLPAQTEEFSAAIQNISDGGGAENLEIAQRIAHTLKGAANVVGVKGIANLTHHLEDILEAYSKSDNLPGEQLITVLVRASDCLESMAETLLGIETEPEDAVNVLQSVLDWANRIDTQEHTGLEASLFSHAVSQRQQPSDSENSISGSVNDKDNHTRKGPASEHLLRVPAALADDMLRLAGENLIFTSQIQEYINVLDRKQEAIDLHNQSLIQLSYDLEHLIDIHGFRPGTGAGDTGGVFDPLELDEYHEAHTISRRLVEIAADSVGLSQELDKDLSSLRELVVNQNQLHKESEELVLRTRMVPIATIVPRLKRGVRQASRTTGKKVELHVHDNNTYMDSEVLNNLIDPLLHVLRNAIDHGIEDQDTRLSRGKSQSGRINLAFTRKGNQIIIDVQDDGRGLDTDEIYSKAVAKGLIQDDENISKDNIQRLILEPGLTTREKVTHVSGRGIGLDVVNVKIRELKGSLDISSTPEKGCRITLNIPISSFSTHSLLVRSRQFIHAISSRGVEEILYPGIGDIRDVGNETVFQLGDETYNAILLDKLLHLPPDRRKMDRNTRPVLLVRDETGGKTAILVQEVLDSRDVVVKSMGSYIPKLKGIIGATVLGDGSVAPVIDLPELLLLGTGQQDSLADAPDLTGLQTDNIHIPSVLVVDDSLSARRSMSQFVKDMGFSVRTARDGMEAVGIIEKSKPDLLLVDMEMPKMNGLELTSHVRATPEINNLPVIMITSRSTDKHRRIAIEKGVNHYMVKPFNEDELANKINDMLETA